MQDEYNKVLDLTIAVLIIKGLDELCVAGTIYEVFYNHLMGYGYAITSMDIVKKRRVFSIRYNALEVLRPLECDYEKAANKRQFIINALTIEIVKTKGLIMEKYT